jgi:hypothetical protein
VTIGFIPRYHRKLEPELQSKALPDLLVEVEAWVLDVYATALAKGERLTKDEHAGVAQVG